MATNCSCGTYYDSPHYNARDNPHSMGYKWDCAEHGHQERYYLIHETFEPYCVPCRAEKKGYVELLKNAPAHDTEEFLNYLRAHNTVVEENDHWLIIANFKYHTPEKPWYTAFHIGYDHWSDCVHYLLLYQEWEWLKKSADKQTVNRFHIHIYK